MKVVRISILFTFLLINFSSLAESKLPQLITKQDKKNIRFISDDGKYTYYQRSNGIFQFSTNYKVEEVIRLKERTQFNIIASNDLKYLLLSADEKYNNYLSLKAKKSLYVIEYGTKNIKKVDDGIPVGLHLNDQYVSYYDADARSLKIVNHNNPSIKVSIQLANAKNPYFIPQVVMPDVDTVIYSDLNKDGVPGVLIHKINSAKTIILEKLDSPNKQVEICLNGKNLFIAEFGLDPLTKGSSISMIDSAHSTMDARKIVYSSTENDLGSLKCNVEENKLHFIKTFRSEEGKVTYDAAEIDVKTKDVQILSDILFATTLVKMDGKLLLPYQNIHYVIKGQNNLTQFDKLKANTEEDTVE